MIDCGLRHTTPSVRLGAVILNSLPESPKVHRLLEHLIQECHAYSVPALSWHPGRLIPAIRPAFSTHHRNHSQDRNHGGKKTAAPAPVKASIKISMAANIVIVPRHRLSYEPAEFPYPLPLNSNGYEVSPLRYCQNQGRFHQVRHTLLTNVSRRTKAANACISVRSILKIPPTAKQQPPVGGNSCRLRQLGATAIRSRTTSQIQMWGAMPKTMATAKRKT